MGNINFELYKVFYYVANCNSITKAAQELYISQPAVSQSIKQLERQIGGKLFTRNSKGIRLTYEGKIVYQYVKEANILLNRAENKFKELQKTSSHQIVISASDTIEKYYLLKAIKQFSLTYKDAIFKISNRTSEESINLLQKSKVDLIFVKGDIKGDMFISKPYCEYNDVFVMSKNYKLSKVEEMSIVNICENKIIAIDSASYSRKELEKTFEQFGVPFKTYLDLGSYDLVLESVKVGLGIGILPDFMVKEYIDNGELVKIQIKEEIPKRVINMVTLANVAYDEYTSKFIEQVFGRKGI